MNEGKSIFSENEEVTDADEMGINQVKSHKKPCASKMVHTSRKLEQEGAQGVHKKHKGDSIVDLPQLQVDKILEHKVDNFHAIKRQNNVPNIAIKQHNSCQKE